MSAPPSYEDARLEKLRQFCSANEIGASWVLKLREIESFDVVFVCDDSGSMNSHIDEVLSDPFAKRKTRWSEMVQTVSVLCDLAEALDMDGIDVFFLNRPPVLNASSLAQLHESFARPPTGCTPIVRALGEVIQSKKEVLKEKNVLMVLATDGQPTDDDGNIQLQEFVDFIASKPERLYLSILACTDDSEEMSYLDNLEALQIPHFCVSDDFRDERKRFRAETGDILTHGTYLAKVLLGPIYGDAGLASKSATQPTPVIMGVVKGVASNPTNLATTSAPAAGSDPGGFNNGVKFALYSVAHKHWLSAEHYGKLVCHTNDPTEDCIWQVERSNDVYCAIRHVKTAFYLECSMDGDFDAKGSANHSKFIIETLSTGVVTLQPHGSDWYLGISMFGGTETVHKQNLDRCHFHVKFI